MKYLADTSVWIDHLHNGNDMLIQFLRENKVLTHPFIIGEIACGNLQNGNEIISLLNQLPGALVATHEEGIQFLDQHKLYGKGIGWIDLHLLASSALSSVKLFTLDKRLKTIAKIMLK